MWISGIVPCVHNRVCDEFLNRFRANRGDILAVTVFAVDCPTEGFEEITNRSVRHSIEHPWRNLSVPRREGRFWALT